MRSYRSQWGKANRDRLNNHNQKRKAGSVSLTSDEMNRIDSMYANCKRLEIEYGLEFHVDHKTPIALGGKHHPDNLQIKTAEYNLRKGSRWIDQ